MRFRCTDRVVQGAIEQLRRLWSRHNSGTIVQTEKYGAWWGELILFKIQVVARYSAHLIVISAGEAVMPGCRLFLTLCAL